MVRVQKRDIATIFWSLALGGAILFALPAYIDFKIQRALSDMRTGEAVNRTPDGSAAQYLKSHSAKILDGMPSHNLAIKKSFQNTIVIFTDFRCGYCHAMEEYLQSHPPVGRNVVFKDLPILGEESRRIAEAAYAADRSGKYREFRKAMLTAAKPDGETAKQVLEELKIDRPSSIERNKAKSLFDDNVETAKMLNIRGTPAIIINGAIIRGWDKSAFKKELQVHH